MAPAAAEMLEALGALDRIVGIGDFVDRPASIEGLPRVGAYNAPNVERVLELEVDLFVSAASEAAVAAHEKLESYGVAVLPLDTSTYDGVFASLSELGARIGERERAREIEHSMREALRAVERRAAEGARRSVLFIVGRDPIYVAGPGSHIDEMIALVGATNVAHDVGAPYQRLSMEAVLERMPDVIIDTSDNRPDALRGRQAGSWGKWAFLPAVRDDRVFWVDPSLLVIPGIRLPEMTQLMGKIVQPELFGEPADGDLSP